MAPAVPATMKLAPLQRNSRRHVSTHDAPDERAIAQAIRPVFTPKYVAMAPTSGRASVNESIGVSAPPSEVNTRLVAIIVSAPVAALNSVRYSGYGCFGLYAHWIQNAATAIEHGLPRPEQQQGHQVRRVRHRQRGTVHEGQRQGHLPCRSHAREQCQAGEQHGVRHLPREEHHEDSATCDDDARDVDPRSERQMAPAREGLWRRRRQLFIESVGVRRCRACEPSRHHVTGR